MRALFNVRALAAHVLAGIFLAAIGARAQMVFYHDASGNPTNSFLSASTGVGTSASSATQTITVGSSFSFGVTGSGSGPLSYQWQLNGTNISGATNATFAKTSAGATDSGSYRVITTGATGSQTNVLGTVTVVATTNSLYAISYALGQFFAVGASGTILSSSNLVSWSVPSSVTTSNLLGIAYGNNTLVAVGAGGTILSSSNGTSWVSRTSGNAHDLMGVAFGNGLFVGVGAGGTTLTSTNGSNWVTQTFDNPTLEAVTFATNLFVAVGTGGSIWTSSNGTNWLGRSFATTNALYCVAYGNGIFVAAGANGLLLTSPDGASWSQQAADTAETFTSILPFNGSLFAIGPIGVNFISADGITWTESDAGTFSPLFGSIVGSNIPVGVGSGGTVIQIPYGLVDHFVWSAINSPQRAGQSFSATITAKDGANNTLTNFNGSVSLSAITGGISVTTNILGNVTNTLSNTGTNTSGYAFTPNADLLVTALRHFDMAKSVSIWTEAGDLLASVSVTNLSNAWVSTPLSPPLTLKAGTTYIIGAYSETGYFYRQDLPNTFPDGTIDQAFNSSTNEIPWYPQAAFWFLVDLTYTAQRGIINGLSPTNATFVNGVASLSPSVTGAGEGVELTAVDATGHSGLSNPFNVYAANDLALTLSASPNPVTVQSKVTYSITVMNPGPSSASSVVVTNALPANTSFVSANSTQGTCQFTNGLMTCSLGSLGSLTSAVVTLVVTATNAGVLVTNIAIVAQSGGSDTNAVNNSASITTYVPPTLWIGDTSVTEGNLGVSYAYLPVLLSSATPLSVSFTVQTLDGTNSTPAFAGRDYVPINATEYIAPGLSLVSLPVGIQGNTIVESNKQFMVRLSNPANATLLRSQATVTITNDDGFAGAVYVLSWSAIASPQRTNTMFGASITARDYFGAAVTNFTGLTKLIGINVGTGSTNMLLNSQAASTSATLAISTVGYQFTPTNDIYVTHVRSFAGTKVGLWTSTGFPILTQAVAGTSGTWTDTQLPNPVHLSASNSYVLGAYTGGNTYYWGNSGPVRFNDGSIDASLSSPGDSFPTNSDWPQWYLVDLKYARAAAISCSYWPTNANSFTNGTWSGNFSANEPGTNFVFLAEDGAGHSGFSSPVIVCMSNSIALVLTNDPPTPVINSNFTYTVTVMNPGPTNMTFVSVNEYLPIYEAYFVSGTFSQGSSMWYGADLFWSVGTINAGASATASFVMTPIVAGLPLTNTVVVLHHEADPGGPYKVVTSVLVPNQLETLALSRATDYSLTPWHSGGDSIWFAETNVTHDGIKAAQSGAVTDSQQTWMETTVRGPGALSFWWKVSSQTNGDIFYFLTNGVAVTNISGTVDWQQVNFNVAPGLTALRWSFIEDPSIQSGSNAAWLDQVSYTIPTFNFNVPSFDTNGDCLLSISGTTGQELIIQTSTNLVDWVSLITNTVTSGSLNYTDTTATNSPAQFYRAIFMNY